VLDKDETILLTACIELAGQAIPLRDVQARVREPNGNIKSIAFTAAGLEWQAEWKPGTPGLFGVDVVANASAPDGTMIERSAFLAIEA